MVKKSLCVVSKIKVHLILRTSSSAFPQKYQCTFSNKSCKSRVALRGFGNGNVFDCIDEAIKTLTSHPCGLKIHLQFLKF